MSYWNSAPFFRLLLPFAGGIITAVFLAYPLPYRLHIFGALAGLLIAMFFYKRLFIKYRNRALFGTLLTLLLFCAGYVLTLENTERFHPYHFSRTYQQGDLLLGEVAEAPVEKAKSRKLLLEVQAVKKKDGWVSVTGHALAYVQKDSLSGTIAYGDLLLVNPQFKEINPPQNPSEFNYKRYLSFHQVQSQSYIPANKWLRIEEGRGNPILAFAYVLRQDFLDIFRKYDISGNEFAVASALILGYKDELDKELVRAYSGAGATHILAVSGLHVGIIYLLLNFVLRFMDRSRLTKLIKAAIMVLALWFYATLTGLSPSVMRAATMFTCVIIGKSIYRNSNIYNTLAASAFFLLMWDPFLLMRVGFQLSYLAVIGIVYIQPKLYRLFDIDNWLLDKIWAITTVSIAAQAATFPLALLYFHQFPNYFFVSNLLVIPMATLILCLGILVFITSFSDTLCYVFAKFLDFVVWLLNHAVQFIEKIPGSITEGITISISETWLIYLLIVLMLAFFASARLAFVKIAFMVLLVLIGFQFYENHQQFNQKKFIVYNVNRTAAYDFISGKTNYFLAGNELSDDVDKMLFHVKHNWWDMGLETTIHTDLSRIDSLETNSFLLKNNFINFFDKCFVIIDTNFVQKAIEKPFKVDYVIISGNPSVSIEELTEQFNMAQIIIDSSNSDWKVTKWLQESEQLNVNCYAVSKRGAYVTEV